MIFKDTGVKFDVNNPDHRAACIAGQAGFVGFNCRELTMQDRARLGYAVQEQFLGMEYKELWKHLMWLSKAEREAIRARALKKVKA